MSKTYRAILLVAVAIGAMGAAEPRRPTGRWVVDYDDAQCVASRNYGTDDKPLFLALKPSPTGSVMRVMLIRNGASSDAEQRPASIRFDDKAAIAVNALSFGDAKAKRLAASINLPMETFAANRRASTIEIKGSRFNERLAVEGLRGWWRHSTIASPTCGRCGTSALLFRAGLRARRNQEGHFATCSGRALIRIRR
jgi:hypothetical protein